MHSNQIFKYFLAFSAGIFFTLTATAAPFFSVESSGTPTSAQISLCLNGRGPVSCQTYTVSATNLSISSLIPNHTYPSAGIKLLTPGTISGGTPLANGYELFSVSDTAPAEFTVVPEYTVGGTVSGLNGTVGLQLNGSETLNVSSNGGFTFATTLEYCVGYSVAVLTQPENQMCYVTNGSGTVFTSNITNVSVTCSSEPGAQVTLPSVPVDATRSGGCLFYNMAQRYYLEHSLAK